MIRTALLGLTAAWLERPGAAERAREALREIPTGELARAARAQGLALLALEAAGRLEAPPETLTALGEAARAEAARVLLLEAALKELAGAAGEKGLGALILKGPALDRAAYPHPGLRPFADLDLLVRGGEPGAWGKLLSSLNYEKLGGVDRTWRRGDGATVDLHAGSPDLAGVIDVPEELSPVRLDLDGIFERAIGVPGLPLPAPGLEDQLVLAAAHGLGVHVFEKLIWLADLAVLLGREPDPARTTDIARAAGADRLLFHSLALLERLDLAEVPEPLLGPLRPERLGRLERKLLERLREGRLPDHAEFLLALALPAPRGYKGTLIKRALSPRRRTVVYGETGAARGALGHLGRLARMAWLALGP